MPSEVEPIYAFRYPGGPHARRHGPDGYSDYRSYRPWLRDEFDFRCVYCLIREGRLDRCNVDLFHLHHRIECALGGSGIGVSDRFRQCDWRDLQG